VGGRFSSIVYFSACNNETVVLACFPQCSKHMLEKHLKVNNV